MLCVLRQWGASIRAVMADAFFVWYNFCGVQALRMTPGMTTLEV